MKHFLPFVFAAAFAVGSLVSSAPGQSMNLNSGSQPDNSDGHSADVLAPRTKPGASTPAPSNKNEPFSAVLSKDDKGKSPSNVFAPTDKIYLAWKALSAAKGDKVRVVWYAEDAKPFPKNKKLDDHAQTLPGPGSYGSSVGPTVQGGLPVGKYRADVYDNTKLAMSAKFTVRK